MNIPANRAVAVLTPALFAPLAGAISVFAAERANMDVNPDQLTAIFIAGATIAFAKSGLWLKGWQDYEQREQAAQAVAAEVAEDPYADVDDADLESSYEDDLEGAFEGEVEDDIAADHDDAIEDDERNGALVVQAG